MISFVVESDIGGVDWTPVYSPALGTTRYYQDIEDALFWKRVFQEGSQYRYRVSCVSEPRIKVIM